MQLQGHQKAIKKIIKRSKPSQTFLNHSEKGVTSHTNLKKPRSTKRMRDGEKPPTSAYWRGFAESTALTAWSGEVRGLDPCLTIGTRSLVKSTFGTL